MSMEYDFYLLEHRTNVNKAYMWIKHNIPKFIPVTMYDEVLSNHDYSKNDFDEYYAYDEYFYGKEKTEKVIDDFNKAWLLHIHRSPHHWQYWVLINDDSDEGIKAVEMPHEHVIEMICDWWSFSWASGNLKEIFDWYNKHKDYMMLHENTREYVEDILMAIREKLD